MIATDRSKFNQVRIELENGCLCYSPGQKCSGRVLIPATGGVEKSTVDVSFIGRIRTLVSSANGQLESRFENSQNFIKITDTLYDGHYVHETGEVGYTFHLVIPFRGHDREIMTDRSNQHASPSHLHVTSLPSSVRFSDSVVGKGWRAAVEYLIEAKVSSPNRPEKTGVIPIQMQTGHCYPLRDLNDPSQRIGTTHETSISSWKLLPESQHSPTTIRQRTASLFRPQSVPKFAFELDISHPKTLQVGNLQNIPFIIGAKPVTTCDKTSIVPSAITFYRYPSITIESVAVELHSKTTISYPTLTKTASMTKSTSFPLLQRKHLGHRLVIRSTASDQKIEATEQSISSVDIGELCNMPLPLPTDVRSGKVVETSAQSSMNHALRPSFASATLTHTHAISWSVTASCSDERRNFRSRTPQPIILMEGPLPTVFTVKESLPTGPAPAYSKHAGSGPTANAGSYGSNEDDPFCTNGSPDRAASDTVQHIMRAAKATAEAALCELPAYSEAARTSSVSLSQQGSQPSTRAEKQKPSKSRKR